MAAIPTTNGGCGFTATVFSDAGCTNADNFGTSAVLWNSGMTNNQCIQSSLVSSARITCNYAQVTMTPFFGSTSCGGTYMGDQLTFMTETCNPIPWYTGLTKWMRIAVNPSTYTPPPPTQYGTCNMTASAYTDSQCVTQSTNQADVALWG